uniref:Anoctamin n=1 Tax=Macrostomum lignano TaxID=282301 RepID=A0A1I8HU45_9PLAT
MDQVVPNQPPDYYTCPFRKSKLNKFLGSENRDAYFTATQRHQVAYEILATRAYGLRRKAEIGIDRLLEDGTYAGAFPLHEGPYELPKTFQPEQLNPRQILHAYWAAWGTWYKYQPLDHIREYYGEKIGLYFAWLGLYTAWLLPASIVGILVFLYGCFTFQSNVPAREACESDQAYKMCPLCDETIGCNYWYLSDICVYIKMSYLFDHPGTVFYSVFIAFWAVTFLENWKRKNASLAHHWDVMDFQEDEERPRPEYSALSPVYQRNPVTGNLEPHFPNRKRIPRIVTGVMCIIIMMVLVVIFIIAVIIYRVLIAIPLFQNPLLRSQATTVASGSAACVNLVLIMSLGKVYEKLAYKLTQWEMHRTQTDFENQLILKVFIFQFVNFYSSILYIAFFKGKFTGYPGRYGMFFGLRNEECSSGGCLIELAQQLAVIMVGKQIINNCQEVFVPKLLTWMHRFSKGISWARRDERPMTRCEADYQLIPYEGLFEEYLEMVLQFGFITIFVAAFPLAPFFALLNNWLEIRLDASKLVCETRRPVSERAQDIGVWFILLDVIVQLSVISNAFLIAFTSEFLPRQLYMYQYDSQLRGYTNFSLAWSPSNTTAQPCRYKAFRDADGSHSVFYWKLLAVRLAFVIAFEHVVFFISRMLDILIPDVPQSLQLKIKREQYLAKQALQDAEIAMGRQRIGSGVQQTGDDAVDDSA